MNTIKDIVTAIRQCADENERIGFHDLRCVSTDALRVWADLLEDLFTNRNQLLMRSALEKCKKFGDDIDNSLGSGESTVLGCAHERSLAASIVCIAERALVEPPRNCDAFSKEEVLKMLDSRSFSKEDTIEWLYATKGEEV